MKLVMAALESFKISNIGDGRNDGVKCVELLKQFIKLVVLGAEGSRIGGHNL
jgi:hypothetical protein